MLDKLIYELDALAYDPEMRPERSAAELRDEVAYLAEQRFWQYTPAQLVPFEQRLNAWLQNAGLQREDIRILLEVAASLQFVDRDDLAGLYRSAFRGSITRWLIEQADWSLDTMLASDEGALYELVAETWFCPVTDSMDIGQFLRINGIAGSSRRPAWKTLVHFGDFASVLSYVEREGYKRIVLLEDFVGTGTQTIGPVRAAIKKLGLPVLFVPLTTSELALRKFKRLAQKHVGRFSFAPVYVVPRYTHVFRSPIPGEPPLYGRIRDLVGRTFERVKQPVPRESDPPGFPFGFNRICGLLFLQYTNCPNNTLPLIWHDAPEWSALFPRVARQ